jgi:hypothetical protein
MEDGVKDSSMPALPQPLFHLDGVVIAGSGPRLIRSRHWKEKTLEDSPFTKHLTVNIQIMKRKRVVLGAKDKLLRVRKDGFNGKVPSSYLEEELLTLVTNIFFFRQRDELRRETNRRLKRVS